VPNQHPGFDLFQDDPSPWFSLLLEAVANSAESDSLLDGPKKNQSAQIAVSDSAVSVHRPQSH
jgi:hypothetical protein